MTDGTVATTPVVTWKPGSKMDLGIHWPREAAPSPYPDGTPFVELAYVHGVDSDDMHSLPMAVKRIERLAATHPKSPILLRVDWQRGDAFSLAIPTVLTTALKPLSYLGHLGGRLAIQVGNEPQLEGALSMDQVIRTYRITWSILSPWLPLALRASTPVAPYNPRRLGAQVGLSREGSPWADLQQAVLIGQFLSELPPHVFSFHVYGDGALPVKKDAILRSADGWRFGLSVATTWREVTEDLRQHADTVGVRGTWISEFNTASRGIHPPNRPADNYRAGWLPAALDVVGTMLPSAVACCWFVGEERGGEWGAFAPDSGGTVSQMSLAGDILTRLRLQGERDCA